MALRALLIGVPAPGLNVTLAHDRLQPVLERMGFSSVQRCVGAQASRAGILKQLDVLAASATPDDDIVVHYFGHGGRVRFPELETPAGEHTFGYVTVHKAMRGGPWEAILDQELSSRLTALDARCGNVTAILDCCFSGELVRDVVRHPSEARVEEVSEWVAAALADDATLALDSHPRIVRLTGASPKRQAFAVERGGRHIGRLTEALIAATDEAGDDWPQLCWETVGHRIREHVIAAMAMEGQWVNLAGPRHRRLFSRDTVAMPGTVAYVPKAADDEHTKGSGWLRAGWLQGVSVGDRWSLIDPRVPRAGTPRTLAFAVVTAVGRNRSEVEVEALDESEAAAGSRIDAVTLRAGTPAHAHRLRTPVTVGGVDASQHPKLRQAVAASPWLTSTNDTAAERIGANAEGLELAAGSHAALRFADDAPGHTRLVETLEDRARVASLRRTLAEHKPSPCPIQWTWRRTGDETPLPHQGATLVTTDRIRVDLHFDGTAPLNWFVSVILIDPAGRPHLLSARMPEGIELGPGDREVIGVRHGRATQGLMLPWPAEMLADEGPASLLILAGRRPLPLQHLVRTRASDDDTAFALQGMVGDTVRGSTPEHSKGGAWEQIDFSLRTSP